MILVGGIAIYHRLVVLELLAIIERMQNTQVAVLEPAGGLSKLPEGAGGDSAEPSQDTMQTVTRIDGNGVLFDLPHTILVDGGTRNIKLEGKILSIAKYVSTDIMAYASVDISSCDGTTCGSATRKAQINRSQAALAIDVEFTNKNRIGSVAIDPGKQFRILVGNNFYTPEAFTNDGVGYIEVPELGTYSATFVVRVPKDTESFRLIFGEDVQNPTGLFDVNFGTQTIESLNG